MRSEVRSKSPLVRLSSRAIPTILTGTVVFACWAVHTICITTFLPNGHVAAAIALLVLHEIFLILMATSFIRLVLTIAYNPGVVPLRPDSIIAEQRNYVDLEGRLYPDSDPDSPGLEEFYAKDVFCCNSDGKPLWCIECGNWKPDRAHHSREIGRCVRKMDHYCPWVGGIISETSFKSFVQFVTYAWAYCAVCLSAASYATSRTTMNGAGMSQGVTIAVMAVAAFFGLFTFTMSMTSSGYILQNLTNVDAQKRAVYQLAIRVPNDSLIGEQYRTITYPLPKPDEIGNRNNSQGTQSNRDKMATRRFVIVRTQRGENPWDLGYYNNWKSVMGNNVLDWFLPINSSPCASYESDESAYPLGPVYQRLLERHNLPLRPNASGGIELTEMQH